MTIKKIQSIKKYKSFRDFSWQKYCNNSDFHSSVNIFYGENGTGKSSICNILKNVSQNKTQLKYPPEEVEIKIDNTISKFSDSVWTNPVDKDSILFFDREFVGSNIHLGLNRGTQKDEQEQKSGKLIIEFDEMAIKYQKQKEKLAEIRNEKNKKLEEYRYENKAILASSLLDEEVSLFQKYKSKSQDVVKQTKALLSEKKSNIEIKIKSDKQLLDKSEKIQQIEDLTNFETHLQLSPRSTYQGLFNFGLKEKAKIEAQDGLVEKIKRHKDFFDQGIEIRSSHPGKCPFCQTDGQEEKIKSLINVYNDLYDDSYKKQLTLFEEKKKKLVNELEIIREKIKIFDLDNIFISLKKLSQQYGIKNIYLIQEEEKYREKLIIKKISELKNKIHNLSKPSEENISDLYREVKVEYKLIITFLSNISKLIDKKNRIIHFFKIDHTNEQLVERIGKNQAVLQKVVQELDFIGSNKIEKEKSRLKKQREEQKILKVHEKAKEDHRLAREVYEKYCSTEAFTKTLGKIESYFSQFNFGFKLQLDTQNRHTGSTKELPFAFKVLDLEGNERDFTDGLSEGEAQVLSLCFFFAFLDIQAGKSQKVLVFDDPITSLDDSNLSSLTDLVSSEKSKFSQIFVLTHHRTFFKFLRKRFSGKCNEYNILRNKKHLGGSFICMSQEERFVERLTNFESHLMQIAQIPNGFDVELKIVEYGQYLRYEVEHFIKCKLLHWNKSDRFADVVDGIKENKLISDPDLDKIKQIYSFCNWTTSHVDVGDDHGMAQLKEKMSDFLSISGKYSNMFLIATSQTSSSHPVPLSAQTTLPPRSEPETAQE